MGPSPRSASCSWDQPCSRPQIAPASIRPAPRNSIHSTHWSDVASLSLLLLSAARTLQDMHLLAIDDRVGRVGDDGRIRIETADHLHRIAIVVPESDRDQLRDIAVASVLNGGDAQSF